MITIVTEYGKLGYNFLAMGICTPGGIFQDKLYNLIGYVKGVKIHINNLLLLSKESFTKRILQLRIIVGILGAAGLKVNALKCSFRLEKIPCLGCNNTVKD